MRRDDYAALFVYHGTRYAKAILEADCIKCAPMGDTHVSLTRNFDTALYWADCERDDDEDVGSVLILDRAKLEADHVLTPFVSSPGDEDEHEEACMSDISELSKYLVSVVTIPVK